MSLIVCPDCGGKVNAEAQQCILCGKPVDLIQDGQQNNGVVGKLPALAEFPLKTDSKDCSMCSYYQSKNSMHCGGCGAKLSYPNDTSSQHFMQQNFRTNHQTNIQEKK